MSPWICFATNRKILVVDDCQAKTVAHPCIQVINGRMLGGANNAVQWYWAPAIGQIEAISARDMASARVPVIDKRRPQTKEEGPPLSKDVANVFAKLSHDARSVTESARIESESNFR